MIVTVRQEKELDLIFVNGSRVGHIEKHPYKSHYKPDGGKVVDPHVMLLRPISEAVQARISERLRRARDEDREYTFVPPPPRPPATMRTR